VSFDEEEHVVQVAIAGQGVALVSSVLVDDVVKRGLLVSYRSDIHLSGATYTAFCLPKQKHAQKIHTFISWLTTLYSSAKGD
jgi:LysR family glycine cleavage system transcriptional activator